MVFEVRFAKLPLSASDRSSYGPEALWSNFSRGKLSAELTFLFDQLRPNGIDSRFMESNNVRTAEIWSGFNSSLSASSRTCDGPG